MDRKRPKREDGRRTTLVKGAWVVGHDGSEHRLIQDGVVVYEGDTITHVGRAYAHRVDRTIDAGHKLVIPGLISTHAHADADIGGRMIVDGGRRDLLRSGFFNYEPPTHGGTVSLFTQEDPVAAIRFGLASLVRNGATTIVELGGGTGAGHSETMVEMAGELGLRLYYGPGFRDARYTYDARGRLIQIPDEAGGLKAFEQAVAFVEKHHGRHDGRIQGLVVPYGAFSTSADLFRRARDAARRLGVRMTFHIAESLVEFNETVQRTGKTPVSLVADLGVFGPDVILGHCIYVSGHSTTSWPYGGDLEAIAAAGATVAHAPLTFARRGVKLESFQRYRAHGVNMGIGTDTYPLDILSEMQAACLTGKIADANFESATARHIFDAATLGGARALGRDDLGRLAPGAKADLVIVNLDLLRVGPYRDPIRALLYCGHGGLVDTVIIGGRLVVEDGRVSAWDEREILADVRASSRRAWDAFPAYDPQGRSLEDVYPPSLEPWHEPEPAPPTRTARARRPR
jgi:YD repeat-containing protein